MSNGNAFGKDIADALSYPILTEEVELPSSSPSGRASADSGSRRYTEVVDRALRNILGWRPNPKDPKSFITALDSSFDVKTVQGYQVFIHTPRSFTVYTELGAVTGAQASVYALGQGVLEKVMPLLEGLTPLRTDSDDEDTEASTAVIRSDLKELVRELGEIGGPRVQRIEGLFESLLGAETTDFNPEAIRGQLGQLRERLGLDRAKVNTIPEEQVLTNFHIVVHHVQALRQTWKTLTPSFGRSGSNVFLGTHLVQLSRSLAAVAESVKETETLLDTVFLGPAERQVVSLTLDLPYGTTTTVTIAELLGWVDRVASEEGPNLIREASKDGVVALTPTLATLADLVDEAHILAGGPAENPLPPFHTARVDRSLDKLVSHLRTAHTLASQIRRLPDPGVVSVMQDHGNIGETVAVVVNGSQFQNGATVRLERAVISSPASPPSKRTIQSIKTAFTSEYALQAAFRLEAGSTGLWEVVVKNPDGGEGRLEAGFSIGEPVGPLAPTVTTFIPTGGSPVVGEPVTLFVQVITNDRVVVTVGPVSLNVAGQSMPDQLLDNNGLATFVVSFPTAELHKIQAKYLGASGFAESESELTLSVDKADTEVNLEEVTGLIGFPPESPPVEGVQLSARVTSAGAVPTGQVEFTFGQVSLGKVDLAAGVAELNVAELLGSGVITASYRGDRNFEPSSDSLVHHESRIEVREISASGQAATAVRPVAVVINPLPSSAPTRAV